MKRKHFNMYTSVLGRVKKNFNLHLKKLGNFLLNLTKTFGHFFQKSAISQAIRTRESSIFAEIICRPPSEKILDPDDYGQKHFLPVILTRQNP